MKLKAHHNVICLAEQRQTREERRMANLADKSVRFVMGQPVEFIGWCTEEPKVVAQAVPEPPRQPKWLWTVLGLGKRSY
jgi:hypothetical protein